MKKGIILKVLNKEKIEKELNSVQHRCTVRTISFDDIVKVSKKIKVYYSLSNKDLNGCKFVVDLHAQTFPSAYKYMPESTKFILEFKNSYWKVLDIYRAETNKDGGVIEAQLTELAKQAIIEHFTYPF